MKRISILVLASLIGGSVWAAQQELTYVDLVKRLTDLEQLAVTPAPGEQCVQWSSYDRKSSYDAATGKYVRLGRQRRQRRHHPQGGGQAGPRRDGRPGLHLADLVRHAQGRARAHLPGRRERTGGGPAVCRLLRLQERAVHAHVARAHGRHGLEQLHAHPLPEIVQGRGRSGLGCLLPVHVPDLSEGDASADLQAGPGAGRIGRPGQGE